MVYAKSQKKAYTLKKRLICSNGILLLVSFCILLFTSYYTIQKIYIGNAVKTYASQLNNMNIQVQSAFERIKILTEEVAQNDLLLQITEQLEANENNVGVSKEIITNLAMYCNTTSLPLKIYLKVGGAIFNGVEVCTKDAECAPHSQNRYLYIEKEQLLLKEYVQQKEKDTEGQCYFQGALESNGVFLFVMNIRNLIDENSFSAFEVEANGKSLYRQGDVENIPVLITQLKEIRENNISVLSGMSTDGQWLITMYRSESSGLQYTAFVNMRQIIVPVLWCTFKLGILSLLVMALSVPLFYITATFTLEPMKKLLAALDDEEDCENNLSRFIFAIRDQISLRRRVYRHHLLVLVPLAAVCLFSISIYRNILIDQEKTYFENVTRQTAKNIQSGISWHTDSAKQLILDRQFKNFIGELSTKEPQKKLQAEQKITEYIYQNRYQFAHTLAVNIYDANGYRIYSSNKSMALENRIPLDIKEKLDSGIFTMFDKQSISVMTADFWFPVLENKEPIGYICFVVDDLIDTAWLESSSIMAKSKSYLYDPHIWSIFYPKLSTNLDHLAEGILQGGLLKESEESYFINPETNERQIAFLIAVPETSFSLLCFVPEAVLGNGVSQLWIYIIFIFCGMILIVSMMSSNFAARLAKPIAELQTIFEEASNTSDKVYLPNFLDNELSMLANSFVAMFHRTTALQQLISEQKLKVEQSEKRRTQLELMVLKEQLNPHFISNLFVSMRFMLRAGKLKELEDTIKTTGTFLRETAMHHEKGVTLQKEIDVICGYVKIQNIRFKDRINFIYDIPSEIEEQVIPQFLLQPLIENAITHAMPAEGRLHISLHASMQNEKVCLKLWNDGIGISLSQIKKLEKNMQEGITYNHIGLVNTKERIRLFYGNTYQFSIQRLSENETLVTLLLPIYRLPENGEERPNVQ
ncbi:sensor histidine kinase [Ruthenibacterium lactatiformans]|uniref:Uncharacterized protein n=1 Tax=Ruthenibacterium lactatiformans TaxID=1550024 RepID=A0A0D8IV67_9FIRM|nr:histidine kinase [Ruthenibacterium lactatiformans]KAB3561993.1 hypothetical protein GAX92_18050 [Phocaeicola vulgatus]KJF38369.1 hypothetical protein TQ39_18445 [Ruthenibacterium lactatiformans]MBN3032140.1 histidine kinase [Ruthenibacterium lactatiformans]MTS16757.1 hypothetical protein [Ruthenibacterium lactatiformans]MTS20239.1 hypothetical protein [Ruthenibacterium lactatiformans]